MDKFVIGIIAFSLLTISIGTTLLSRAPAKATLNKEAGAKLSIDHSQYNFGSVKYNSTVVEHRYPVKNDGQKNLKIANLASSCACTKVYFKSGSQISPRAGMKGMTKLSDWTGVLKPGESGELIMEFDPTFHGIGGIGKISRSLSFETNDPKKPYMEMNLSGEVTN